MILCAILALGLAATDSEIKTKPAKTAKPAAHKETAKPADPVEAEYEKLLEADEASVEDVDRMVKEFQAFEKQGAPGSKAALAARIDQRLDEMEKLYEDFLAKHPKHVEARLAYGSFLNEADKEEEAIIQWEKAREIDPSNPSAWNNLANIFGHIGPVKKAFTYYEKAIELDPKEPIYLQNLAVSVYLFRKDAAEAYRIDEAQVFDKALDLYKRAMKLDSTNLVLATEYAQSYYGIKPTRVEDALAAWNHALTLAKSPAEKQGIYLHLARVQLNSGRFQEAEQNLGLVTEPEMQDLKARLRKNLDEKRSAAKSESGGKSAPKP